MKQKFIESKLYCDNEYLDKYIELINKGINCKNAINTKYYEKHHIFPKSSFKRLRIKDKKIIDANDNLVLLTITEHIMAHYYLYKCAINEYVKLDNLHALTCMLNEKDIEEVLDLEKLKEIEKLRMEWRDSVGSYTRGKKRPNISKYLLENHFDCSGALNSRAVGVCVYNLDTLELINKYGCQKEAAEKLGILNLKERLNKSKYKFIILDNKIIAKETYDVSRDKIEEFIRDKKLKDESRRKYYTLKCKICGKSFTRLCSKKYYSENITSGNCCCSECSNNGSMFKGKSKSQEWKTKASISATGRKWVNNGVIAKQVKEPELSKLLKLGWKLGYKEISWKVKK